MGALSTALEKSHSFAMQVVDTVKSPGVMSSAIVPGESMGSLNDWRNDAAYRERYSLFRGVLYSAINALATEAANQPVCVGRQEVNLEVRRANPGAAKYSDSQGLEVLEQHPLLDILENPNPIQHRWQFVYSFVSNLCLTGWSYIVAGENEEGVLELYTLPTTWVKPKHDNGPFSSFIVQNPKCVAGGEEGIELTREQVAFAHLPNPSDPLSAVAPASSQMNAIRADDSIWASREQFFNNGVFPGAIVTIGKDPHPDVPAGVRPRLTAEQRRQVQAAIKKVMSGVANYGNPAIVDGLIESVAPISAVQNEMGWEKSEQATKQAILSAFCVHPYILGEAVGVGGYAQVAAIERRFVKRVNVYLDMLSNAMTNFIGAMKNAQGLKIWWEPAVADDADLKWRNLWQGRTMEDVTREEIRAELGLPPLDADDEEVASIAPEMVPNIIALLTQVGFGAIWPQQAAALMQAMGIPTDIAMEVAGVRDTAPSTPAASNPVGSVVSTEAACGCCQDGADALPTPTLTPALQELRKAVRTMQGSAHQPELLGPLKR